MKTTMLYAGEITLQDLENAHDSLTLEELKAMSKKLDTVISITNLPDHVYRLVAKEYFKLGYIAAHCEPDDATKLEEIKKKFENIY